MSELKYSKFFCNVYSTYGWNYFSETFGELLLTWIDKNHLSIKKVLDLGCGTGNLCNLLSQKGIQTIGVDLSEAMIEIARSTYPDLFFEIGDMTKYHPTEKIPLVTCIYDAINHVLDPEGVLQVFRNVLGYLEEGGYFIFDILSSDGIESCPPEVLEETEDGIIQFQIQKPEENLIELSFFTVKNQTVVYSDTIRERVYDQQWILEALKSIGFGEIQIRKHLLDESVNNENGWIIIARK